MRKIIIDLKVEVDVLGSSSIYHVIGERYSPQHIHELKRLDDFDGLAVVVLFSSTQSAANLLAFFNQIEIKYRSEVLRRSASLNLLVFDDQTVMTPQLTLPHPELHVRPEFLLLAAEIWGDYVHPILRENLYFLTQRFRDEQWGRFYAQGKTLLDF